MASLYPQDLRSFDTATDRNSAPPTTARVLIDVGAAGVADVEYSQLADLAEQLKIRDVIGYAFYDSFTGDSVWTSTSLSGDTTTERTLLFQTSPTGETQKLIPTTDYSVSGSTLSFVAAPPTDYVVELYALDVAATVAASGIANVSEDTTPQLGGDLDVNGNSIVSVSNGSIPITPHGTGTVDIKSASLQDAADATKEVQFTLSGITTGNIRTVTFPDQNVDLTPNTGTFVGTARQVSTQYSLTGGGALTSNLTLNLVGDASSPGNSKLYGTDATGTRGWYDQPGVAGYVLEADFDANTILAATSDDTPVALTVAEQTLVGRITAGNIAALTATEVRTLLNVADGATAGGSGLIPDEITISGGAAALADATFSIIVSDDGSGSTLPASGVNTSRYLAVWAQSASTIVTRSGSDTIADGASTTITIPEGHIAYFALESNSPADTDWHVVMVAANPRVFIPVEYPYTGGSFVLDFENSTRINVTVTADITQKVPLPTGLPTAHVPDGAEMDLWVNFRISGGTYVLSNSDPWSNFKLGEWPATDEVQGADPIIDSTNGATTAVYIKAKRVSSAWEFQVQGGLQTTEVAETVETASDADRTLEQFDRGKTIYVPTTAARVYTISQTVKPGFHCSVVQAGGSQITFAAGGTGTILSYGFATKTAGQYARAVLSVESNAGSAPQVYLHGEVA